MVLAAALMSAHAAEFRLLEVRNSGGGVATYAKSGPNVTVDLKERDMDSYVEFSLVLLIERCDACVRGELNLLVTSSAPGIWMEGQVLSTFPQPVVFGVQPFQRLELDVRVPKHLRNLPLSFALDRPDLAFSVAQRPATMRPVSTSTPPLPFMGRGALRPTRRSPK